MRIGSQIDFHNETDEGQTSPRHPRLRTSWPQLGNTESVPAPARPFVFFGFIPRYNGTQFAELQDREDCCSRVCDG